MLSELKRELSPGETPGLFFSAGDLELGYDSQGDVLPD